MFLNRFNRLSAHLLILCLLGCCIADIKGTQAVSAKTLKNWLNRSPRYEVALQAIQQYNYGQALDILTQLQAKYPHHPRYTYDLILVHQRLGHTDKAHHLLQQLQHQFPNSIEAQTIQVAQQAVHSLPSPAPTESVVSLPAIQIPTSSSKSKTALIQQKRPINPLRALPKHVNKANSATTRMPPSNSNQAPKPSFPPSHTEKTASANTPVEQNQQNTSNSAAQMAQMQQMMNQMMMINMMSSGMGGGLGQNQQSSGGNSNPMTMMMLPLMMQQMGTLGPNNSSESNNPYGQMDPDTLSTMMMNQVMGSMDFSGSNKKDY